MGGFFGTFGGSAGSGSGSANLGTRLNYASPAGVIAAAPAGFNNAVGILSVTLAAGNATWTALTAGGAGQLLEIRNDDAANTLTLPHANWGGIQDVVLAAGQKILTYYDGTLASWQFVNL